MLHLVEEKSMITLQEIKSKLVDIRKINIAKSANVRKLMTDIDAGKLIVYTNTYVDDTNVTINVNLIFR